MTVSITLSIDAAGNYKFKKASGANMHKKGHLWLLGETQPIDIAITIDSQTYGLGYFFASGPAANPSDGSNALFISDAQGNKRAFTGYGQFYGPLLSSTARSPAWNVLTFWSQNTDGNGYFYQLNFAPGAGLITYIDPILINRC